MKFFHALLAVVATALFVLGSPNDVQRNLDAVPSNRLTITFYTQADCKEDPLDYLHKKSVVLSCTDDSGANIDPKAAKSTCVSGKFASYKISDQAKSLEKLSSIGVTTGHSQCNFLESKPAKIFKPSVTDYAIGGCHNFGAAKVDKCNLPLGIHDDTVYTYQCSRTWVKSIEKRKVGEKGKGPAWTIDGARSSNSDGVARLEKRIEEAGHNKQLEKGKIHQISNNDKGKGYAWVIEGAACGKGIHCNPSKQPRLDDGDKPPAMEKRWKHNKGKGDAWLIEGVAVPADKSLFCDVQ